jgi:hypothetical protein
MKRITISLFFSLFFVCFVQTGWSQNNFDWTLALVDVNADTSVSFSQPIVMKTGETFTLFIKNEAPCYCYIIIQDSEQNVQVLQNRRLAGGEELKFGPIQIMPPAGSENFYVVMSSTEQRDLSSTISIFQKNNSSRRAARDVMNEVLRLRRSLSMLKENPEKPVDMGGAFRGTLKSEGVVVSGSGSYVKTITINH